MNITEAQEATRTFCLENSGLINEYHEIFEPTHFPTKLSLVAIEVHAAFRWFRVSFDYNGLCDWFGVQEERYDESSPYIISLIRREGNNITSEQLRADLETYAHNSGYVQAYKLVEDTQ